MAKMDPELRAAIEKLENIDQIEADLVDEKHKLEDRLRELATIFEDGGPTAIAKEELRQIMAKKNLKCVVYGDFVAILVGASIRTASGLVMYDREVE